MSKDFSYKVTRYAYECDLCGRRFESDGQWAIGAVRACEKECKEKLEEGLVRVLLPPPGQWDSMFRHQYWIFVKQGSPKEECAKQGHVEIKYWKDGLSRPGEYNQLTGRHERIPTEYEAVECTRCGVVVSEFQGRRRDKVVEMTEDL